MFKREINPLSDSMIDGINKSIDRLEYVDEAKKLSAKDMKDALADDKAKAQPKDKVSVKKAPWDMKKEEVDLDEAAQPKWKVQIGKKHYTVTARNTAEANTKAKTLAAKDGNRGVGGKIERINEAMDPVDAKAVKKKFDDREDKDIDNDGDVDSSDEYLHKRRKAISKALAKEEVELDEIRWEYKGDTTYMVGSNLSYDDKMEYKLSKANADILNRYMKQAKSDAERSKVWSMFWHSKETGNTAKGPEMAIAYVKKAIKEEVELDEATATVKQQKALKALMRQALGGKNAKPGYTSSVASNGDFTVADGGGRIVGRLKGGSYTNPMSEEVELDEAPRRKGAPKIKPDFLKTQRAKDAEHNAAMGRTKTGRKKPVRAMSSTQRSLASMRKEEVDLDESVTKLSNSRLKYHATKGFPHGSFTNAEIEDEHKRRMKIEPNYHKAKPSLSEEVDLGEAVNVKGIKKAVDDGKSMDAIVGMFANKRTTNTDEIRKVVKDYMWNKRMKKESLDEAKSSYTINHKTFSGAVQHALAQVEKQGYTVDDDEWDRKVAMGPKKPGTGKTNRYTIALMKGGKETKRNLQMQVYYDEGRYELNMYIS